MEESAGEMTVQVTDVAPFKTLSLTPLNATVGSQSTYRLSYSLDMPADPACLLRITAPSSFKISETVAQVKAFKTFKGTDLTIDGDTLTLRGCEAYTSADLNFDAIDIFFLNNPPYLKDSDPFKVEFLMTDGVLEYMTATDTEKVVV